MCVFVCVCTGGARARAHTHTHTHTLLVPSYLVSEKIAEVFRLCTNSLNGLGTGAKNLHRRVCVSVGCCQLDRNGNVGSGCANAK